ncbi:putative manganese transporter [Photobacterium nomapromontoriensis]|uniref:putative manganese transporter n=1 Tax=Photobacterium nomapromontoriensis TaxID=2910237 RepID=UPI003D0D95C3
MATLSHALNHYLPNALYRLANKRLILPVIIIALLAASTGTQELTTNVLADAFWQVATYVAATLTIYHVLADKLNQKNNRLSLRLAQSARYQVIFASAMGALPGCGGAIVVITQFVRGRLSFGAVVAVLTATMGDAAFLLIATEPTTGLLVMMIGFFVGIMSGLIIDAIHGSHFLRPSTLPSSTHKYDRPSNPNIVNKPIIQLQGIFWQWMLLPASIIAVMGSFQIDIDHAFHLPDNTINIIGAIAALIAMSLWATSRDITNYESAVSEDPKIRPINLFQRVAQDTNFVTSWVIAAFLIFELTIYWSGINLTSLFSNWLLLLPLMGVLIGLLPGCGPQILVTGLYLSGMVPFSTQLGNAISNDGDALFPAIALAPKAALVATIYSSIPALIVAYGYFFIFEYSI